MEKGDGGGLNASLVLASTGSSFLAWPEAGMVSKVSVIVVIADANVFRQRYPSTENRGTCNRDALLEIIGLERELSSSPN